MPGACGGWCAPCGDDSMSMASATSCPATVLPPAHSQLSVKSVEMRGAREAARRRDALVLWSSCGHMATAEHSGVPTREGSAGSHSARGRGRRKGVGVGGVGRARAGDCGSRGRHVEVASCRQQRLVHLDAVAAGARARRAARRRLRDA
jgi:hypothetical protein